MTDVATHNQSQDKDRRVNVAMKEVGSSLQLAELTRYAVIDPRTGSVRLHRKGREALSVGLRSLGLMPNDVTSQDQLKTVIERCKSVVEETMMDAIRRDGRRGSRR